MTKAHPAAEGDSPGGALLEAHLSANAMSTRRDHAMSARALMTMTITPIRSLNPSRRDHSSLNVLSSIDERSALGSVTAGASARSATGRARAQPTESEARLEANALVAVAALGDNVPLFCILDLRFVPL